MPFDAGAHVHVAQFGKGVVREVRNGGRYLVDIKDHAMVVSESQLTALEEPKRARRPSTPAAAESVTGRAVDLPSRAHAAASIDLHGKTAAEAQAAVDEFLNDALLAGLAEVRVIHGISGGRVKTAVHARLKQLPSIRTFRVDPANPGVTIVKL